MLSGCAFVPAGAAEQAPIPAFLRDNTERGEDDVYDKFPDIHGVYAHGVAGDQVLPSSAKSEKFCQGTEKGRQDLISKFSSTYESEFWFFGTKNQGVVFIRSIQIPYAKDNLRKCADLIDVSLEVQRGYVADGFIHSFAFDKNALPPLGSFRTGRSAGEYSGAFIQLQTLMARSALPPSHGRIRTSQDTVAGLPVICSGMSGLVWNSTCYATSGDLRGMLLRSQSGDDERVIFNYEVTDIQVNKKLPGVVFEVDRDWSLRD